MLSTSDRDVATAMLAPDYLTAVQKNDNELIKRLMAAQRLLEKAEQGEEEPHELFHFAKQLGQPWMMSHKHKSIRCLVACCISDVLRLYAPNPPYDPDLLKAMFELFFQQLRLLRENDENFPKRFALLESLATLKMPLLLVELCGASDDSDRDDSPLLSLFDTILDIEMPKGVPTSPVPFQVDILTSVVTELSEISPAMLDSLLKRLLPTEKSVNAEAAEVAKETLRLCASRLIPVVSELLTRSSATSVSELSDRKTSSELIFQLSQIDPEYLLYVLPSVCRDLQDEDIDNRSSTVDLLGRMFLANANLITKFHKNFVEFLARFHDKDAMLRCAMITFGTRFLLEHASVAPIVAHELKQRVTDVDATVRLAVVKSVCDIACVPASLSKVPSDLLYEVLCRVMDKKSEVQLEAIKGASQLFYAHLSERKWQDSEFFVTASSDDEDTLTKVMIVPGMLLNCYAECESAFLRFRVMQVFEKLILPTELASDCRARGLLMIYASLSPHEKLAFVAMLKDKLGMQRAVEKFLRIRAEKADGMTDALMDIARRLPAQDEAFSNLQELLDYKDKLIFAGLERLCHANLPLSETARVTEDVCSRVGMRNDKKVLSVMKLVLRMTAMETVDVGMVSALLSDVADSSLRLLGSVDKRVEPPAYVADQIDAKTAAMELVLTCARQYPELLESSIDSLVTIACVDVKRAGSPKDGIATSAMKLLALFASHVSRLPATSHDRPIDDAAVGKLVKLCSSGSAGQAKYAGKTLAELIRLSSDALTPGSSRIGDVLSRAMREWLSKLTPSTAHLDATMTALSEFALCAPVWFLSNRGSDALVFAEKCVNDNSHVLSCGKLLTAVVRGLFTALPTVPSTRRAALQAEAKQRAVIAWRVVFQCLASTAVELKQSASRWSLRMCRHVTLDNALTAEQWLILAQLPQDDDRCVARAFSSTLMKELNRTMLPVRFLAVAMLTHDAYTPQKGGIQSEMRTIVRKYRLRHSAAVHAAASNPAAVNPGSLYKLSPLACLPFAVHLLSHLPTFPSLEEWEATTDVAHLSRHIQQSLSFLLDALVYEGKSSPDASANGAIAMLLHMLSTMRCCDDAVDPSNIGMHITGELATQILKEKIKDAASLAGTKFEVYLPPSLFKPAASPRLIKLPDTVGPPDSPDPDTSAKHRRMSGSPLKRAAVSAKPAKATSARAISVESDSGSEGDDRVGNVDQDESAEDARKKRKTGARKKPSSTKENKASKPPPVKTKPSAASETLRRARPSRAASSSAVSYYVEGSSDDVDDE